MQLAGELSKISIPSLIQLVRNGGLTGEITLSQGTRTATIGVEQGRVVHVETDAGGGREAFLELFLWTAGTFSFTEGLLKDTPRNFPVLESIDRILREGMVFLEQKRFLDQLHITGQTVLEPMVAVGETSGALLLDVLDGKKPLSQIVSESRLTRRAYVQAVYNLLSEGLAVVAQNHDDISENVVELPAWVANRLQQDNSDLKQAIIDLVVWADRVKCWMYQTDADLEQVIAQLSNDKYDQQINHDYERTMVQSR